MAQLVSIDVVVGDEGVGDASRAGETTSPVSGAVLPQAVTTQKMDATRSADKATRLVNAMASCAVTPPNCFSDRSRMLTLRSSKQIAAMVAGVLNRLGPRAQSRMQSLDRLRAHDVINEGDAPT